MYLLSTYPYFFCLDVFPFARISIASNATTSLSLLNSLGSNDNKSIHKKAEYSTITIQTCMCDKSEPKQKCQKGQCDSIDPMLSQKKIKLEKSNKHMPGEPKPQYKQQEIFFDSMDSMLSQKKVKPEKSKMGL